MFFKNQFEGSEFLFGSPENNSVATLEQAIASMKPFRSFYSKKLNSTFNVWSIHFRRNYPKSLELFSESGGIHLKTIDEMLRTSDVVAVNLGVHWHKDLKREYVIAMKATVDRLKKIGGKGTGKVGFLVETLPHYFQSADGSGDFESKINSKAGCAPITTTGLGWRNEFLHQIASAVNYTNIVRQYELMKPYSDEHIKLTDCMHYKM